TGYDVRRGQDVVNPRTDHCNIMVLSNAGNLPGEEPSHPFSYARVLGIYHLNVIYTGPDTLDYQPRRMEVLWVRWFEVVDEIPAGWEAHGLDTVRFAPMTEDDAFGFVDPADVVRGCHLVPAFARGRLHSDGIAMSSAARDANDWKYYYVNRYV
ncbi:hypothetical protein BV22DRAFT_968511, partial [Leucogyrophana mollusca]